MYKTHFQRPATLAEASAAFAAASEARYLGGGQTLIPTMKQRLAGPSDVISLTGIAELKGISAAKDAVTIGAGTTHFEVANSAEVKGAIPTLAALAGSIGDPAVRHRGTLGGSLANNDPSADYPSAVLALGARIVTDKREIAADDYFQGMFTTALEDGEIILRVKFPVPKKAAYQKFKNPASRFAIVGVFVAQTANGARVAVTGAGSRGVFRVKAMEDALNKSWSADAIKSVAVSPSDLQSDLHASAEYRAHLIGVLAMRAVSAA